MKTPQYGRRKVFPEKFHQKNVLPLSAPFAPATGTALKKEEPKK
jgi:hypothetical protein